jgi:hypothetical protein
MSLNLIDPIGADSNRAEHLDWLAAHREHPIDTVGLITHRFNASSPVVPIKWCRHMSTKQKHKIEKKTHERDFAALDQWARSLKLEDGRPLSPNERREHERAKRVRRGRPAKAHGEKAGRYMVSMDPALHKAAVKFSRIAKVSLSSLIAEALAERIDFRTR